MSDDFSPTSLVYMPNHDDPAETEVSGVKFVAYEPVSLDKETSDRIGFLEHNRSFGTQLDPVRHGKWNDVRAAETALEAAKAKLAEVIKG